MKTARTYFINFSVRAASILLCVIGIYLFLNSIFSTCLMWYSTETTYYISDFALLIVLGLCGMMAFFAVSYSFWRRLLLKIKPILVFVTVVWAALMIGFVWNTDIVPVYDQARVLEAIAEFVGHNYAMWEPGGYMHAYPFQNGLVLLYSPVMLILGRANIYIAAQCLNVIYYFLLVVMFYKLSKAYFGKSVAVFTYVSVLFFFPLWGYVKYFYGNLPGLFFIILAVYCLNVFLTKQKYGYLAGALFGAMLATMYKGNFLIYIIAGCIILLLAGIQEKKAVYSAAALLLVMAAGLGMKGPALLMHEITGCITNQGIPSIDWVAMGLHESYVAPGWYSGDSIASFVENGCSVERASASAWERIQESLAIFQQDKGYAVRFFCRKTASIWNNPTFEGFSVVLKGNIYGKLAYWMKDILYNGGVVNSILTLILDILHSIYLFGMLLYLFCCRKEQSLNKMILPVAFIGGFLFHIFWEAKCQYTIIFFVVLLPYAFAGYLHAVRGIRLWFSERCEMQKLWQSKAVRKLFLLFAAICVMQFCSAPILDSTIKLGGDGGSYIWSCQNSVEWKNDNFTKEGPVE